jgi:hypothetical protein
MRYTALGVLLTCLPVAAYQDALKSDDKEEKIVAEIRKFGGKVIRNEKASSKPVVAVDLRGTKVSEVALAYLKGLSRLRALWLSGTNVADGALVHLKGLPQLEWLFLDGTPITDTGLTNLEDLTALQVLFLSNTQITDTGVGHLKNLTRLKLLQLDSTRVTDAGLGVCPSNVCFTGAAARCIAPAARG